MLAVVAGDAEEGPRLRLRVNTVEEEVKEKKKERREGGRSGGREKHDVSESEEDGENEAGEEENPSQSFSAPAPVNLSLSRKKASSSSVDCKLLDPPAEEANHTAGSSRSLPPPVRPPWNHASANLANKPSASEKPGKEERGEGGEGGGGEEEEEVMVVAEVRKATPASKSTSATWTIAETREEASWKTRTTRRHSPTSTLSAPAGNASPSQESAGRQGESCFSRRRQPAVFSLDSMLHPCGGSLDQ